MKIDNFIEGLQILRPYYTSSYVLGTEHDVFFAYVTEERLPEAATNRLFELGWFQPDVGDGPYDPEQGWAAYV
jgi:hypothetical protein